MAAILEGLRTTLPGVQVLFAFLLTLPLQTAFAEIRKLEPGHWLRWKAGKIETHRYWLPEFTPKLKISEEEAIEEVTRLLAEATSLRMISEVPLGAFLSGGVDSSTVVALMARESSRPVKTFSIGFEEQDFSELKYAKRVAEHIGADGVRVEFPFDVEHGEKPILHDPDVNLGEIVQAAFARSSAWETILPPGTGLSDRFSDFVGRTTVRVGRRLAFVHRFRLDKDNLAVRRNEIDATVGGRQTYATIGYLRLDRDIDASIEDLRDREELRIGGRVRFARYWSIFGSAVIDLTDRQEDPLSIADGFDPVRHRIGILYDDDCIELGVTWRRDYETSGDARRGNTFLIRVALRNLGR